MMSRKKREREKGGGGGEGWTKRKETGKSGGKLKDQTAKQF